jgi:demethoxyubiquinone hydroxylase (CLK1/Coq7/Cat5 family)
MKAKTMSDARANLIRILQNAHAGELAAAFAYRGHWKSLRESLERTEIKKIEDEEWQHRGCIDGWLKHFNAKPRSMRERVFWTIGRVLGVSCFLSGRFMPMYFAGRLESQNVQEYVEAAKFAGELGLAECRAQLMEMSATEQRHEDFFKAIVQGHSLLPLMRKIFRWG